MHAFPAPVCERSDAPASGDLDEPSGEVSPRDVAVAGAGDPARDETVADAGSADARQRGVAHPRRRVLEIEEAEIVLAALADNDLTALVVGAWVEAVEFAVDLPLQVAGIGGDPHRAVVLLHPHARGREIAEGSLPTPVPASARTTRGPSPSPRGAKAALTAEA